MFDASAVSSVGPPWATTALEISQEPESEEFFRDHSLDDWQPPPGSVRRSLSCSRHKRCIGLDACTFAADHGRIMCIYIFSVLVHFLWWLTVWSLRSIPTAGQGGGGGGQAAAPRARGSKDGPPRPQARRSPAVRPGQSPGLHRCAPCCLPSAYPLPERASDPDRLRIGL